MAPFGDPCLLYVAFMFLVLIAKKKSGKSSNSFKTLLNSLNTQEMYDVPFLILSLCTHCPSLLIVTQVIIHPLVFT